MSRTPTSFELAIEAQWSQCRNDDELRLEFHIRKVGLVLGFASLSPDLKAARSRLQILLLRELADTVSAIGPRSAIEELIPNVCLVLGRYDQALSDEIFAHNQSQGCFEKILRIFRQVTQDTELIDKLENWTSVELRTDMIELWIIREMESMDNFMEGLIGNPHTYEGRVFSRPATRK